MCVVAERHIPLHTRSDSNSRHHSQQNSAQQIQPREPEWVSVSLSQLLCIVYEPGILIACKGAHKMNIVLVSGTV